MPKKMTFEEFEPISELLWVPVVLAGDGRPDWMRGIPDETQEVTLSFNQVEKISGISYRY